jgi:hypothetical protein
LPNYLANGLWTLPANSEACVDSQNTRPSLKPLQTTLLVRLGTDARFTRGTELASQSGMRQADSPDRDAFLGPRLLRLIPKDAHGHGCGTHSRHAPRLAVTTDRYNRV